MCADLCVCNRKVDAIFLIDWGWVRDPCFHLIFPWLTKGCGTSHFPFSSLSLPTCERKEWGRYCAPVVLTFGVPPLVFWFFHGLRDCQTG